VTSSSKAVQSTVCARGSATRVRGQVAQVESNQGQPLTVQLGSVLRGEEAASQCSTWRSGTTTRSTRFLSSKFQLAPGSLLCQGGQGVLGQGRQVEVADIFDVRFNFGLLATISPGEEQTVHGLLGARQGSQVPVEGHALGMAGLTGIARETYGFHHDGGERHHHIY
jgi:hypothetical protein